MLGCASKAVLNGVAVRAPPPEKKSDDSYRIPESPWERAILTEKSNPRTNSGGTPPPNKTCFAWDFYFVSETYGAPFFAMQTAEHRANLSEHFGKACPFLGEFHFNISIPKGSSMQLAMVLVRIFRQLQSGSQEGVVFLLGGGWSGKRKKTNKHKHCGRDGVRDKQAPKAMVLPNQASSNCDTTDSVTTIRLPSPVALQRHKLLNGHLWLKWKTDAEHQGLAHNYDYNDYSQRELREPRDDMKTRRPPRQESLLQWCVVVCVTIITTVWRRKRDRLWLLPQEYRHKEKGATATQRLGRLL